MQLGTAPKRVVILSAVASPLFWAVVNLRGAKGRLSHFCWVNMCARLLVNSPSGYCGTMTEQSKGGKAYLDFVPTSCGWVANGEREILPFFGKKTRTLVHNSSSEIYFS